MQGEQICTIPASIAFWGQKAACQGQHPLNPLKERMEQSMYEALFFAIGLLIGGLFGVVLMCLLQINRDGKEHGHE